VQIVPDLADTISRLFQKYFCNIFLIPRRSLQLVYQKLHLPEGLAKEPPNMLKGPNVWIRTIVQSFYLSPYANSIQQPSQMHLNISQTCSEINRYRKIGFMDQGPEKYKTSLVSFFEGCNILCGLGVWGTSVT